MRDFIEITAAVLILLGVFFIGMTMGVSWL